MPIQEYIKHVYENEDASIADIARRTGICWRTAGKYAKREDWNQKPTQRRTRRVMDPVAEIVDTWLLEDRLLPRKQRRNAAAIYLQLTNECGFIGSERTVRAYVSLRRAELFQGEQVAYVELEQLAGDAQVDFGTAIVVQNGKYVDVQVLVLSFPFSNACFAYPLPAQNRECFMEGLKRLFARIGGVPKHIRIDNLAAAVAHIGPGEERQFTEMFERFKLHYRFEVECCNPARGNEKGHVENKVGYVRRQWLVGSCSLDDGYEELAELLWERAISDMKRPHYRKGETIAALWETDMKSLLSLPTVPFEVVHLDAAWLNKYSQFRWEKATYEVPQSQPRVKVLLSVFWDKLEVRSLEGKLLTTLLRQYMPKERTIDWAAYFVIYAKRPRAALHARLFPHLPPQVREFLKQAGPEQLAGRVRLLRDALKNYSMDTIAKALVDLPQERWNDRAILEHKFYSMHPDNALLPPLNETQTPPEVAGYEPDPTVYDQLNPTQKTGGGQHDSTSAA